MSNALALVPERGRSAFRGIGSDGVARAHGARLSRRAARRTLVACRPLDRLPIVIVIVDSPGPRASDVTRLGLWRAWMDDGTRRFDAAVRRVRDDELREPSELPGWSRAHLVAHIARNGDALGNLITWARTGIETPMYASAEQRADDIEGGARRSAKVLRADLEDAERRFAAAVASLPPDRWWSEVRTRAGRVIPAAEVLWMRCREVWVHAVDLGTDASFSDLPGDLVEALIEDVTGSFGARPDCDDLELVATDTVRSWPLGASSPDRAIVRGDSPELLAWLLGRSPGIALRCSTGSLPSLPGWL